MEAQEDKLYCPHCGSTQLTANKKGFGAGKAIGGAILTGGVGLLAGFIGSGKVKVTCLKCGCEWKAGQLRTTPLPPPPKMPVTDDSNDGCLGALIVGVFLFIIIALCSC